jgi:hypothetical protein
MVNGLIAGSWNVTDIVDGSYELGINVACGTHFYVTGVAPVIIDRAAPRVLPALTRPSTRSASLADEVSVTFNEPVVCSSVSLVVADENGRVLTSAEYQLQCLNTKLVLVFDPSAVRNRLLNMNFNYLAFCFLTDSISCWIDSDCRTA